jgi:hypothetical protein
VHLRRQRQGQPDWGMTSERVWPCSRGVAVQSLNYPACLNRSELFVILYEFKKVETIGREADVLSCIASISRSRLIALLLCMEGIQAITSDVVNVSAGAQAGQLEGVASFALSTPRSKNTHSFAHSTAIYNEDQ